MAKTASTQQNIPIAGMKDGIIILNDGQYRIVMELSAINFALKSEQEQNSLIFQYQGFLNSLHFPVEIVVQSKKLDLSPYVAKVKKLALEQKNDLLKIQTEDYADFVTQLIDIANIMKKRFFVVVGYQPLSMKTSIIEKLFPKGEQISTLKIPEDEFIHYAKEIRQRATTVAQNLGSMGLHCKQLSTQEMIEDFYLIYNPELAGKERLSDVKEMSSSLVSLQKEEEAPTDVNENNQAKATGTIDNSAQVAAEQKRKQNEMTQEKYKNAEKKMEEPENAPQTKKDEPGPEIGEESKTIIPEVPATNQAEGDKPHEAPKEVADPNLNKNFEW